MSPEVSRYDRLSILTHWVTAALMIFMMIFGEALMGSGSEGEGFEEAGELASGVLGPSIHVSLGAAILGLTVFRIAWRLANPAPPYPPTLRRYEQMLARVTGAVFYLLLIGIPVTGWFAFSGYVAEEPAMAAVRLFGVMPLPPAPFRVQDAKDIHEIGGNVAILLTVLHVLAALKHQFIDRDGTLGRMLPH
ncbi:cytochrome b [Aestuariivirga sp.]|jgi:cytochrome b561|uniref:cytochrome b n=1 Tax=Aestuariivirga sp. TaxID=2650926 RepID=UPI003783AD7D